MEFLCPFTLVLGLDADYFSRWSRVGGPVERGGMEGKRSLGDVREYGQFYMHLSRGSCYCCC
jgi:hypothetical protein